MNANLPPALAHALATFAPPQSAVHQAIADQLMERCKVALPHARSGLSNEQIIDLLNLITADEARIDRQVRSMLEQVNDAIMSIEEAKREAALWESDDEDCRRAGGDRRGEYDAAAMRILGSAL